LQKLENNFITHHLHEHTTARLDGPALYDWMVEPRPHLGARTAFITADALNGSSHCFLAHAGRPVPEKPFVQAELRELLAQILSGTD
jgi:hypothetical protein